MDSQLSESVPNGNRLQPRQDAADKRVVRLIQKWLNAGVLEEGKLTHVDGGTSQGGSISPLLANIYLHYVLDASTPPAAAPRPS